MKNHEYLLLNNKLKLKKKKINTKITFTLVIVKSTNPMFKENIGNISN